MFCPNCGQQQTSGEMRFCPRCGFQLGVVRAVLSAGDPAPVPAAPDRAQRKKDMTIGAALMFLCAFAAAVITIDMPASHSARILLLLVFWVLLTLAVNLRPLWHYFAGPAREFKSSGGTQAQLGSATASALPPARAVPASDFAGPRFDTADVARPPSVTERTTNLISEK